MTSGGGLARADRRAVYGAEQFRELAARLKADFGSGYGVDNLELFRRFYPEYLQLLSVGISDAPRRKSGLLANSETVCRKSRAAAVAPGIRHAVSGESSPILHAASGQSTIASSLSPRAWQPGVLHPHLSSTHYRTPKKKGSGKP